MFYDLCIILYWLLYNWVVFFFEGIFIQGLYFFYLVCFICLYVWINQTIILKLIANYFICIIYKFTNTLVQIVSTEKNLFKPIVLPRQLYLYSYFLGEQRMAIAAYFEYVTAAIFQQTCLFPKARNLSSVSLSMISFDFSFIWSIIH